MMTPEEAILLGRRLRSGDSSEEERAAMKNAFPDSSSGAAIDAIEASAVALAAAVDIARIDAAAVAARDDAESLLVVLGAMGAEGAERRVAARVAEIDAVLLAQRDSLPHAAVVTSDAWLHRIASLDASTWWLDLVALASVREAVKAFDPASAFRGGPRAAPMRLRGRPAGASLRLHAEVVGMDDDPARTALERGAVIARMFDGEVEVYAVGLRADQDDLPAGLCVARRGGGVADITHVALAGTVGGKGHSGWWTTISHSGTFDLVVRLGEREEALALEISAS